MNLPWTADKRKAPRDLFPMLFIIGFSLVFVIICLLAFPKRYLLNVALTQEEPAKVTQFYLEKLLMQHPNDLSIQIALAQQAIGLHEWDRANHDINLLAMDDTLQDEVSRLQFLYAFNQAYAYTPGKERDQAIAQLKTLLPSLANLHLTATEYHELGTISLKLGSPQSALVFFQKVYQTNNQQKPAFFSQIADVALQTSQYQTAADFYAKAATTEKRIELQRYYYIQALKSYQSGNMVLQGVPFIEKIPPKIVDNNATLVFLTEYLISAGRPDLAQQYIMRALTDHQEALSDKL